MGGKKANIEKLAGMILTLFHSLARLEEKEKALLESALEEADNQRLKELDLSLAECGIIGQIQGNEKLNTTGLAQKSGMSKGGVSKLTARMAAKKLLLTIRLPDNQKEVYYKLAPLGEELAALYSELIRREERRIAKLLSDYGNKRIEAGLDLVGDLMNFVNRRGKDERRKNEKG
jgi:DNA-binding MarR family transcriptional regulator